MSLLAEITLERKIQIEDRNRLARSVPNAYRTAGNAKSKKTRASSPGVASQHELLGKNCWSIRSYAIPTKPVQRFARFFSRTGIFAGIRDLLEVNSEIFMKLLKFDSGEIKKWRIRSSTNYVRLTEFATIRGLL